MLRNKKRLVVLSVIALIAVLWLVLPSWQEILYSLGCHEPAMSAFANRLEGSSPRQQVEIMLEAASMLWSQGQYNGAGAWIDQAHHRAFSPSGISNLSLSIKHCDLIEQYALWAQTQGLWGDASRAWELLHLTSSEWEEEYCHALAVQSVLSGQQAHGHCAISQLANYRKSARHLADALLSSDLLLRKYLSELAAAPEQLDQVAGELPGALGNAAAALASHIRGLKRAVNWHMEGEIDGEQLAGLDPGALATALFHASSMVTSDLWHQALDRYPQSQDLQDLSDLWHIREGYEQPRVLVPEIVEVLPGYADANTLVWSDGGSLAVYLPESLLIWSGPGQWKEYAPPPGIPFGWRLDGSQLLLVEQAEQAKGYFNFMLWQPGETPSALAIPSYCNVISWLGEQRLLVVDQWYGMHAWSLESGKLSPWLGPGGISQSRAKWNMIGPNGSWLRGFDGNRITLHNAAGEELACIAYLPPPGWEPLWNFQGHVLVGQWLMMSAGGAMEVELPQGIVPIDWYDSTTLLAMHPFLPRSNDLPNLAIDIESGRWQVLHIPEEWDVHFNPRHGPGILVFREDEDLVLARLPQ